MISKLVPTLGQAMAGIPDAATVLAPASSPGMPAALMRGLAVHGARALTDPWQADGSATLPHRHIPRTYNPNMAMAANRTTPQTAHVLERGATEPDNVHTAGVFVQLVLHVPV